MDESISAIGFYMQRILFEELLKNTQTEYNIREKFDLSSEDAGREDILQDSG